MINVTPKDHNYAGTLRGKALTFSYNGTSVVGEMSCEAEDEKLAQLLTNKIYCSEEWL